MTIDGAKLNGDGERFKRGSTLRPALVRFATMLIEEARDLTGLSYSALDHELDLCPGHAAQYGRLLISPKRPSRKTLEWESDPANAQELQEKRDKKAKKLRAPQADEIQDLENHVAKLLKRPANTVVIENNALLDGGNPFADLTIGVPDCRMNLRHLSASDLQLGYEHGWPTYRRLKYSPMRNGMHSLELYLWQYAIFWDRPGFLQAPWTRKAQGLPPDAPVESFLPQLAEREKLKHKHILAQLRSGRKFAGWKEIRLGSMDVVPEFCRNRIVMVNDVQLRPKMKNIVMQSDLG